MKAWKDPGDYLRKRSFAFMWAGKSGRKGYRCQVRR
jgi:hypothetical protein